MPDTQARGIIIDWGGVLTSPLKPSIDGWLHGEGIDVDGYRRVMKGWMEGAYALNGGANPIHALERGEVDPAEFERALAVELRGPNGSPVAAEGLLRRMFAGFEPVEPMYAMLRRARAAGLRTCLLSNSWGNSYPTELFDELFDAVVISGEVGMRKPEERIFRHTVEVFAMEPASCVFIDDIVHNVEAAMRLGIGGVHHRDPEATIAELERLTGITLR
ncbi:MAG: HAD-IA family hydrolase [Streptosporangiales bacterium]|nr:HAD-IA family hydrolase [Streptosporangiales bacterium]